MSFSSSPFFSRIINGNGPTTLNLSDEVVSNDPILKLVYAEWGVKSLLAMRPYNLDTRRGKLCVSSTVNFLGLVLVHSTEYQDWTKSDIEFIETAATHVAISLAQAHIIEVEKSREVAERGIVAKGEFLAMMSHEIRYFSNLDCVLIF
jgi:GAF domain-containing protein